LRKIIPNLLEDWLLHSMILNSFQLKKAWQGARTGSSLSDCAGNTNWGGRLSTVDLLIKVACFVKKANAFFNIKRSWSKRVSTRRSTVLSLSLQ